MNSKFHKVIINQQGEYKFVPIEIFKNKRNKISDIFNISWTTFKKLKLRKTNCPICFSKFKKLDAISITVCNHIFHTNCLLKWGTISETCPICRKNIPIIN